MFINFKNHIRFIVLICMFFTSCQLKEPSKNHGILFLENRFKQLELNKSNKNDVIKLIGLPHTKSINNNNEWVYIERVITRGEYHKLGQNVLKLNNVLVLNFNKYGILEKKDIFNKEDINKIKFSEKNTETEFTDKSFVEKFLSSVKAKMYGNR